MLLTSESDVDKLRELNLRIGEAESEGNRDWLANVIGPALAFRRANGTVDDRDAFLAKVKPGAQRRTDVTSIEIVGQSRAIVRVIVSMTDANGTARYDNLRLFVRNPDGAWRLVGWANEELPGLRDAPR